MRSRLDFKGFLVILAIAGLIATISLPRFNQTASGSTVPQYHGLKPRPSMLAIQMPGEKPVAPRR